MLVKLSYPMTPEAPVYPSTPNLTILENRSIQRGDSANTSIISFSSHAGTHIDLPLHFCRNGSSVSDLLGEENSFSPVFCIEIRKECNECLSVDDLQQLLSSANVDTRALLIKTGWSYHRKTDPEIYVRQNPWVSEMVPAFLRNRFPKLSVFGIDTISISNFSNREHGRACHHSFLCEKPPIMLLEDLDLSKVEPYADGLMLHIYPLIMAPIDGVPVHVFASKEE